MTVINKHRPEEWLHLKNTCLSDRRISGLSPLLSRHIFNAKNYLLTWRTLVLQSTTSPEQSIHVQKKNGNSFLNAPLTSHPASAMGTGRAFSMWDGKTRKHNFCVILITPLSTATVSMYIKTAEQSVGLLADITWWSS